MKQKLIIAFSLVLLLVVIYLMWKDFYVNKNKSQKNPYEYNIDNLKNIDPELITFNEISQIKPEIEEITAIAIDENDRVYITGKKKVIIYKDNNLVSTFKIDSIAYSINISPNGDILLGILDHIEILDKDGNLKTKWEAVNENSVITSIATKEESIFVADAGNKVVYHYDFRGKLINEIGKKDSVKGAPGFIIPSPYFDLLIGNRGELWIVNPGLHTFENYDPNGNLISSWKRTSMQLEGFSGCCNPSNIAMLSDGSFVTSEKGLERIKVHSPTGDFKSVVAAPESFIEGTAGLDLAVDSNDRIYVLDPVKKLIRIFEKK
ncbi:hypothetical protein ACFLSE_04280 [Bacteroidota bacterium]